MRRETRERMEELMGLFGEEFKTLLRRDEETPEYDMRGEIANARDMLVPVRVGVSPEVINHEANISPYEINIRQVNNGIIVNIGCQTFVFEDIEKFSKMMIEFYKNPTNSIESFYKGELFK
jgi:hypothetical protein